MTEDEIPGAPGRIDFGLGRAPMTNQRFARPGALVFMDPGAPGLPFQGTAVDCIDRLPTINPEEPKS